MLRSRLNRSRLLPTVAIISALALASCGGGGNNEDGDVTLTFANWQWLEPGRGERMWEAMKTYEGENPDVTLEQQAITRDKYESSLQTQIGGGGGPDLLIVPPGFLHLAGSTGILATLDGVLSAESETTLQPNNEGGVYDGERLGYTWEAVNWALIWNKSILDEAQVEPPSTPEELLAAAEELTEHSGDPSFAVRHQLNEEGPWWTEIANWPCGFGGGWSSNGELTIDAPENVTAVNLFKELYDSGTMPVGDDASTYRSRFANGEIAMMIDNASGAHIVTAGDGSLKSQDIAAAPLPFPTDNSSQVVNFIGINANSDHVEEAKDFITWLFSAKGQELAADSIFPSTVGTTAEPSAELLEANPWLSAYQEQAKTSTCSPLIAGYELQTPEISTIVLTQIARVLNEDVPADEALKSAQQEAENTLG